MNIKETLGTLAAIATILGILFTIYDHMEKKKTAEPPVTQIAHKEEISTPHERERPYQKPKNDVQVIASGTLDPLDGSSFTPGHGITYTNGEFSQCAELTLQNKSELNPSISSQGTVVFWVNVKSGFVYNNYNLGTDYDYAYIFTNTGYDAWYPGSFWLQAWKNGDVSFRISTTSGKGAEPLEIKAFSTPFRFNEWHKVGISYGSGGQHLFVDGKIVASNPQNTQPFSVAGSHCGNPTLGYFHSCSFSAEQFDIGFTGLVDNLKISSQQQDW